jgi:hypothetical protein
MPNFNTSQRLFHLLCAPLLAFSAQAVQSHNGDYRSHKFTAQHHLLLSIFAQLRGSASSIALIEELNDLDVPENGASLRQMIGFEVDVFGQPLTFNQSSFSRANTSRSHRLWKYCFHKLWQTAKAHCQPSSLEGLGRLVAVDGTLFDCLPTMSWANYRSTKNKLKGHFFFNLDGLPERLVLTVGSGSERDVLRTNLRAGVTYLLDRGYNDYQLFAHLMKKQAHFVTRLLSNALVEALKDYPVDETQELKGVVSDQKVLIGKGDVGVELRMVVVRDLDGKDWSYITSRFDITATRVVELYLHRWEIETFFGWIKRHLQLGHWYSENENGILIQLYAGLITFLLLKIYAARCAKVPFRAMRLEFIRWIRRHLADVVSNDQWSSYCALLDNT